MKIPYKCCSIVSFRTKNIPYQIPLHKSSAFHTLDAMKDSRLLFYVHGRKFYLAPPRRPGGPYYIRFEPPSNGGKRIGTIHRSLRTNVIAAAKARANLIIEPILNGQCEAAE